MKEYKKLIEKQDIMLERFLDWSDFGIAQEERTELKNLIAKIREESMEYERERIKKIIKEMPNTFPEFESDDYDEAYKDAKKYMLTNIE